MSISNKLTIRTPLLPVSFKNKRFETEIFLKPENLQPFGSYKIRGIENVFHHTPFPKLLRGVSAASAGNMGQALAYMAKKHNYPCTIYVPESTPEIKKDKIQSLDADLIALPFQDIWKLIIDPPLNADDVQQPFFIHPVFTESLLLGYERLAEEIIADLPDVDAIVIPFGIGGLAVAVSRFIKQKKPDAAIFLCEPETAAPFKAALQEKKSTPIKMTPSFVDAIGTPEVLPPVFNALAPLVEDSEVVKLSDIKEAMRMLLINNKLLCEGAAACSFAAALNLKKKTHYRKIVSILTGGNLSTEFFNIMA